MAGRRADVLDIREVIRRLQLGEWDRRIARDLQVSRKTVGKYRAWAAAQGLLTGLLPDLATLQAALATTLPVVRAPTMLSSVEPFRAQILDLRARRVECRARFTRSCATRTASPAPINRCTGSCAGSSPSPPTRWSVWKPIPPTKPKSTLAMPG